MLALAALGLAAFALAMALRRRAFTLRQLLGALGRLLVIAIVALLAAVLVAAVLSLGVQRPHGWFARPVLAVWGFGAASFAAAIGMMAWRRRRRPDEPELLGWAAALLLWALLLLLMTIKNLGSAYLPLWWTAPQAAGLLGALYAPKWRRVLWLISFVPGAVLVLGLIAAVFPFVVADTGLMPAPAPLDIMIAVLVALTVVALLPALLALIGKAPHLGRISLAWALFAVVGAVVMAAVNPYSFERPKRITATVAQRGRESGLYLASHDPLPLGPALRGVPEAVASPSGWSPLAMLRYGYRAPARSPSFEAPRVEVLSSVPDRARGVRVVRLRLHSGGPRLQLKLPRAPVRGWSLGPIPEKLPDPSRLWVVFEGAAPEDKEVTLELVGSAPVEVELVEVRAPSSAPEVQALKTRLPPWTALDSDEVWSVTEEI